MGISRWVCGSQDEIDLEIRTGYQDNRAISGRRLPSQDDMYPDCTPILRCAPILRCCGGDPEMRVRLARRRVGQPRLPACREACPQLHAVEKRTRSRLAHDGQPAPRRDLSTRPCSSRLHAALESSEELRAEHEQLTQVWRCADATLLPMCSACSTLLPAHPGAARCAAGRARERPDNAQGRHRRCSYLI